MCIYSKEEMQIYFFILKVKMFSFYHLTKSLEAIFKISSKNIVCNVNQQFLVKNKKKMNDMMYNKIYYLIIHILFV